MSEVTSCGLKGHTALKGHSFKGYQLEDRVERPDKNEGKTHAKLEERRPFPRIVELGTGLIKMRNRFCSLENVYFFIWDLVAIPYRLYGIAY